MNTPEYSSEFAVTNLESNSLNFHCGEVKRFIIEFMADSNEVNKEMQVRIILNFTSR